MELKEIRSEIKDLIQEALQDFLDLVVEDKWQEQLYSIAKNAVVNKELRATYRKAYNKLDSMDDRSKFSTKDMDTSLIVAVTYYYDLYSKDKKDRFVKINPKTGTAIYNLSDARNDYGHLSGNESQRELYQCGLVSLHLLKDFIEIVDCYELSIDESKRNTFKKQYLKSIDKWTDILEEAHTRMKQKEKIHKDIQLILNSNDLNHAWATISEPYYRNWKPPMGEEEYITFITEAAKAGIVQAYASAAGYYYSIAKDYDMAEKYLEYLYRNRKDKQYDDPYLLYLANIYLNKLSTNSGDDKAIIEMLIADGHNIKKSDDGKKYFFVHKENINDAPIKESFAKARAPMDEAKRILKEGGASSIKTESEKGQKQKTLLSHSSQSRKSGLTVGSVSGSKKMRLGRVHKKKTDSSSASEQN